LLSDSDAGLKLGEEPNLFASNFPGAAYGEQLRAVLDHVVLAEYQCHYDWRAQKVTDICDGVFYPTRFASPQGALIPVTPQDSLIVYRPKLPRRLRQQPFPRFPRI